MTQQLASYIRRELDKRDKIMTKAVGQILGTEQKAWDAEIAALRTTIDGLREQVAALEQRIGQVETPRAASGLRAV